MKKIHWVTLLCWIIILFGLVLRLYQYGLDRSLWLDEALIATNFIDKTLIELLQPPLDYTDGLITPPGFLVITKLLTALFGLNDWILRLFPLFSGLLALLLFYRLAQQFISPQAVPFALFLFSISGNLIYYSSEFKQYSTDVLITIILLLFANDLHKTTITPKKWLLSALIGTFSVWFSHAAAFILATIGIFFLIHYSLKRQWIMMFYFSLISLLWLSSFLLMYSLIITKVGFESSEIGQYVVHFWRSWQAFMPFPLSKEAFSWIYLHYFKLFSHPADLKVTTLVGILFIVGCFSLWAQKKASLFLLIVPIFVVMFVSYFEKYPFSGRMLLFLLPAVYFIVAEGIVQIHIQSAPDFKWPITTLIQLILILSLIDFPIYEHRYRQEIKPLLQYVQQHRRDSEVIYIYHWTEPAFRYYAHNYGFDYHDCHLITPIPKKEFIKEVDYFRLKQNVQPTAVEKTKCVLGVSEIYEQSRAEITQLSHQGKNVWFIFSHIEQEKLLFLEHLDRLGTRKAEFQQPGASAYLYTFAK